MKQEETKQVWEYSLFYFRSNTTKMKKRIFLLCFCFLPFVLIEAQETIEYTLEENVLYIDVEDADPYQKERCRIMCYVPMRDGFVHFENQLAQTQFTLLLLHRKSFTNFWNTPPKTRSLPICSMIGHIIFTFPFIKFIL